MIKGTGDRSFCAGGDVRGNFDLNIEQLRPFIPCAPWADCLPWL